MTPPTITCNWIVAALMIYATWHFTGGEGPIDPIAALIRMAVMFAILYTTAKRTTRKA